MDSILTNINKITYNLIYFTALESDSSACLEYSGNKSNNFPFKSNNFALFILSSSNFIIKIK